MRSRPRRPTADALILCAVLLAAAAAIGCRATRPEPGDAPSAPAGSVAGGACSGRAPEPSNSSFEREVVALVNAERRAAGLPPLQIAEPLVAAARWFARDMAVDGYFAADHDTYDNAGGRLVRVCEWQTRIASFSRGWTSLAENVAAGAASPREVVTGWMGSPPHRAAILGPYSDTGVGYWNGGPLGSYWVQDFGLAAGAGIRPQ